jgi:RND family efflux transporter MFP subunit
MPTDQGGRPAPLAPDAPRPTRRTLMIAAIVAAAVALFVVVAGVANRSSQAWKSKTWTQAQSIPVVSVVSPISDIGERTLTLPGTLQAWYAAQIFSRVPGYVHIWYDDIGARVKAGQVLAIIDTPDLDAQIDQARADLVSAQANQKLADITARRWSGLLKEDAVSTQESDEKTGDLAVKTAQVNAARSALDRLLSFKVFSRITAPFNGVVTARHTDIGALVNAGASAGANGASELFEVSQIQPLRLYVDVPQVDAAEIRPGGAVTLTVPEYPDKVFSAKLTTTSNAVSVRSGTLLTELVVDNPQGLLKPGEYAQVKLVAPPAAGGGGAMVLRVPSSALLFRKEGTQLALLGPGDRVRVIGVGVGRDLGQTIEITRGLSPGDKVIDNPPDSIVNGELVRLGPSSAKRTAGANAAG